MSSKYRQAMLYAFSFPAALFVILPLAVMMLLGSRQADHLVGLLALLLTILVPLYATGFLLAPWAGRQIKNTKIPAFFMAAAAALSPAVALCGMAVAKGDLTLSLGTALAFACLALPASLLGALLFIGGCQRLHATGSFQRRAS